jgi:uncharacterized protein (DUF488 family)
MPGSDTGAGTMWSVGHSNRAWEAFEDLLRRHAIAAVADVRAFPTSRRWPHFAREEMTRRLADAGIAYRWVPALGGRRRGAGTASPHRAWTVAGFRSYADHMETAEFRSGLVALEALARENATAVVCAEAVHWRCHRRLLADALAHRGWRVLHIDGDGSLVEHRHPPFLRVVGDRLVYDVMEGGLDTQAALPFAAPRDEGR